MAGFQSRITHEGTEAPDQLLANPANYRRHPKEQLDALEGALDEIGWIQRVIVNERTGHLIDGHARVELAIRRGEKEVPVVYVDLSETEERIALATLDPITGLAFHDEDQLAALLEGLEVQNDALADFLDALKPTDSAAGKADAAETRASLVEQFLVPPFTVLDARQGYWQDRKRMWLSLGIKSELGRGQDGDKGAAGGLTFSVSAQPGHVHDRKREIEARDGQEYTWAEFAAKYPEQISMAGDSIFDPVLCEIAYRWFCPPGGSVLDPFAGGSVRGAVAGVLGYRYTGIDLRQEQIEANRANWAEIKGQPQPAADEGVEVKVSAAMARLKFAGCSPEYIASTCHASCCESSGSPTGTIITIHPSESAAMERRGAKVEAGLLQPRPGERKCPFKTDQHLCGIHFTPDKPFGCIASPFTLNSKKTLIVRNRYKSLKCYRDGDQVPAYKAFRASLDLIFGQQEAQRISDHLDSGGGDLVAKMPLTSYVKLSDNDAIKHGNVTATVSPSADGEAPRWIAGDSRSIPELVPADEKVDLVFSCPPYADLEVYSDDPADISNMGYQEFREAYRDIIEKACARLIDNRFAVFVVGDVRDQGGFYRGFVSDTIQAFEDAGLKFYNEAIFVTPTGSLAMRAGHMFRASRKLGKGHQNVLIFAKGAPGEAPAGEPMKALGQYLADYFGAHRTLLEAHEKVLVFAKGDPKEAAAQLGAAPVEETEEVSA